VIPAQGDASADGHAFAQLEGGDGALGAGDHGLLTGNGRQFGNGFFHQFIVLAGGAEPDVQGYLFDSGNLH
jgi:hypothetical protein